MEAHAHVTVRRVDDRDQITALRSSPPLTLRKTGPAQLHMVGSAAGPIGGDRLRFDITVGQDATLSVGSVAAGLAYPGPHGQPSLSTVGVDVHAGGTLHWTPQPAVLVVGCDAHTEVGISLAPTAKLLWREAFQLGRWAEPSGSLAHRLSVDRAGAALLRTELHMGPLALGSDARSVLGDHRAVGSAVLVGWPAPPSTAGAQGETRWACHRLADDAVAVSLVGSRLCDVEAMLTDVIAQCTMSERAAGTEHRST